MPCFASRRPIFWPPHCDFPIALSWLLRRWLETAPKHRCPVQGSIPAHDRRAPHPEQASSIQRMFITASLQEQRARSTSPSSLYDQVVNRHQRSLGFGVLPHSFANVADRCAAKRLHRLSSQTQKFRKPRTLIARSATKFIGTARASAFPDFVLTQSGSAPRGSQ